MAVDAETYDFTGQVAWNRDSGLLWDRTRRRLRDYWPSVEFFIVREWQDRGVLHTHALVRVAVGHAPDAATLREAARTATAVSAVDGAVVGWGAQSQCDRFNADGAGAKTVWYLSKALNYVLKDVSAGPKGFSAEAWSHQSRLDAAARRMRCHPDCVPSSCTSMVHSRLGAHSHVVSASRRTRTRPGWSFTGLTRRVQRALRSEWAAARRTASPTPEGEEAAPLVRDRLEPAAPTRGAPEPAGSG